MALGTAFSILSLLADIASQGIQGSPMPLVNRLIFGKLASKLPVEQLFRKYKSPAVVLRRAMMKLQPEEYNTIKQWVSEQARWRRIAQKGKADYKDLKPQLDRQKRYRKNIQKNVVKSVQSAVKAETGKLISELPKEQQTIIFQKMAEVTREERARVDADIRNLTQLAKIEKPILQRVEAERIQGTQKVHTGLLRQRKELGTEASQVRNRVRDHRYTLNEIMNMSDAEISRLPAAAKRRIRRTLYDVYQKRRMRIHESGVFSPAMDQAERKGIIIDSQKNISDKDLDQQIIELRNVLRGKTSTVRGARKFHDATQKKLGERGIPSISAQEYQRMMRLYEEMYHHDPWSMDKFRMYQIVEDTVRTYDTANMTDAEVRELLRKRRDELFKHERDLMRTKLGHMLPWRTDR